MSTYIYGKIFASMFEGSLCGAGSDVFAVMAYVIARMQPDHLGEEYVRLHPNLLSVAIGAKEEAIIKAIKFLCRDDDKTTTEGEDGRRLVMESPFVYRVVNGKLYRGMMNEEDRRSKAAIRQKRFRDRRKLAETGGAAMPSSATVERLAETHGSEEADRLIDRQVQEMAENRNEIRQARGNVPRGIPDDETTKMPVREEPEAGREVLQGVPRQEDAGMAPEEPGGAAVPAERPETGGVRFVRP